MELAIKSSLTQPLNDKSMLAAIKSEMAVFECSGVRGRILQLVHSYLQSITSTSVEAERVFPLQGHFVQRFVRASVMLRWILCAFCAAIIANRPTVPIEHVHGRLIQRARRASSPKPRGGGQTAHA